MTASQSLGWMAHILAFLGCMGLAGLANRTTVRPIWNGALIYIVLAILWTIFLLVELHSDSSRVPEHLRARMSGEIIGEPLLVVLVAIYYAWKFIRDHRSSSSTRGSETPGWLIDSSSTEKKQRAGNSAKADETPAWLRDEPTKKPWWKP